MVKRKVKSRKVMAIAVVVALAFVVLTDPFSLAVVASSGFESGTTSDFSFSTGTAGVVEGVAHGGTKSLACDMAGSNAVWKTLSSPLDSVSVVSWVRFSSLPDSWKGVMLFVIWDTANAITASVSINNMASGYEWGLDSGTYTACPYAVAVDTWYELCYEYNLAGNGSHRLYVNGVLVASNVAVKTLGVNSVSVGACGNSFGSGYNVYGGVGYFDDVRIDDAAVYSVAVATPAPSYPSSSGEVFPTVTPQPTNVNDVYPEPSASASPSASSDGAATVLGVPVVVVLVGAAAGLLLLSRRGKIKVS